MLNIREKLIELLESAESAVYWDSSDRSFVEKIADHLIASGVTFATDNNVGDKWIPVTERLPEENDDVLCYRGNQIGALRGVYTYKGDGKWEDSRGYWNYTDIEGITHWTSLPEPPEEGK